MMELFKPYIYLRKKQQQGNQNPHVYILNIVMSVPYAYKALVFTPNGPEEVQIRIDRPPVLLNNPNGIDNSHGPMNTVGTQMLFWTREIQGATINEDTDITVKVLMNHHLYQEMETVFQENTFVWEPVKTAIDAMGKLKGAFNKVNLQNTISVQAYQEAITAISAAEDAIGNLTGKLDYLTVDNMDKEKLLLALEGKKSEYEDFIQSGDGQSSNTNADVATAPQALVLREITYAISTIQVPTKGADSDIIF